ncbi:hypothetical protein AGMMS49975_16520 [Clostridia bacterium]|nr:hypothetical protein AGMMS49975_16520 [Clostridia bacterium]
MQSFGSSKTGNRRTAQYSDYVLFAVSKLATEGGVTFAEALTAFNAENKGKYKVKPAETVTAPVTTLNVSTGGNNNKPSESGYAKLRFSGRAIKKGV